MICNRDKRCIAYLPEIVFLVLHRWFEKYNHREMLLCRGSRNRSLRLRLFAAVFFVVLAWGLAWGSEAVWRKGIVRLWHFATRSIITAIAIAAR